ncbi:MAG TPA: aspartate-semialdehyde dehydrogenase [Pseudonocardiaceae bacterium]|nr:aspartate-semialdehyde dehydrogenase [Pseudonocardiaceae bacterium]
MGPRVAVVGATGAVGTTFLELFAEREFPLESLHLVASRRSAGRTVPALGADRVVAALDDFDFGQVDVAFFSAGTDVSRQWAPKAAAAGALVIDNTNAFRMDPDSPLVVPQVNGDLLDARPVSGIIGNPNCSTIPMVRLLRPVHQRWGIDSVVVSTYQAASGRGHSGVAELLDGTAALVHDPDGDAPDERFPMGLPFNVIPHIDQPLDDGFSLEEQKMLQESRKILGLPALDLTATCVRVPVVNSHSEAVYVRCASEVDRAELAALLAAQPEVRVHAAGDHPTPRTVAAEPDLVHVGRVRVVGHDRRGLWLWLVADNLRIGAALNAVQIAEQLLERGVL